MLITTISLSVSIIKTSNALINALGYTCSARSVSPQ